MTSIKQVVVQVLDTIVPLHDAAKQFNVAKIFEILQSGADVNFPNKAGNTALHIVLNNEFQGHFNEQKVTDCVTILIDAGADLTIRNRRKLLPLELAIKNKLHSSIKLLLEAGARTVGSLVTELPTVVKERFNDGVWASKDENNNDIITLDWRPVLGYTEKIVDKNRPNERNDLPPESQFLYQAITANTKNKSTKEDIINHPLVMAYLFLKAKRVPKRYYLIQLFEVIYLVIMAVFIYILYFDRCPIAKDTNDELESNSTTEKAIDEKCDINLSTVIHCYVILVFTAGFGLRDVFLLYRVGLRHLLEWRDWVWRLSLLITLPVVWPAVVTSDNYELTYSYPFCSVSILLLSLHALIQMETFKLLSVYVEIFVTSLLTVVKLVLMFSPVYLGFYMGFNLMFSDVTRVFSFLTMSVDAGSDNFDHIGDQAKDNSFMFELLSKAFAFAFILVMCVGFMNYVLAMSIDDVQRLKKDAKISRVVREVRNILQVDQRSRSFRLVKDDLTKAKSYLYSYQPDADDQELPDDISLEIVMLLKRRRDELSV